MVDNSHTVTIQELTEKGHGVAHLRVQDEERPCEVKFSLPGEQYQVQRLRKKVKKRYQTRIEAQLSSSSDRQEPKCEHFGRCGGCVWQHADYTSQLAFKDQRIKELFSFHTEEIASILPAPSIWEYRNKMEFSFSQDREGNHYLGLCLPASRGKVLTIHHCHLVSPWFSKQLAAIRSWWVESSLPAYNPHLGQGLLRSVTLRESQHTKEQCVMLTVDATAAKQLWTPEIEQAFLQSLASVQTPTSVVLALQVVEKGSPTHFSYQTVLGKSTFSEQLHVAGYQPLHQEVSASSFLQPNTKQAELFYAKGLAMLRDLSQQVVYDLYCGAGAIGMLAAQKAKKVIGIELHPQAIEDAKRSLSLNQIENISFYEGRVEEKLPEAVQTHGRIDVVIVDPPREGLGTKVVQFLAEQKPKQILYISCNAKTQAIDTKEFIERGYVIQTMQPVDAFPHTPHFENLLLLQASK